jgi:uncharacterized membrane protein
LATHTTTIERTFKTTVFTAFLPANVATIKRTDTTTYDASLTSTDIKTFWSTIKTTHTTTIERTIKTTNKVRPCVM